MVTVLVPGETTERCYLSEALFYVALGRLPLSFPTENYIDARVDYEYHRDEEIKPFLPGGGDLTETECEAAGLKPNPEFDRPTPFEKWEKRKEKWNAKLQEFFDDYRLKLFASLHEGRLPALGKKLPKNSTVGDINDYEFGWWNSTPWEPIPPRFWISSKIDWNACHAPIPHTC